MARAATPLLKLRLGGLAVSDIVERLRSRTAGMGVRRAEDYDTTLSVADVAEAADEIERLREERDAARREALEESALIAKAFADEALGWLRTELADATREARWNGRVHASQEIAAAIRERSGA